MVKSTARDGILAKNSAGHPNFQQLAISLFQPADPRDSFTSGNAREMVTYKTGSSGML
jgi:hypothetical protein